MRNRQHVPALAYALMKASGCPIWECDGWPSLEACIADRLGARGIRIEFVDSATGNIHLFCRRERTQPGTISILNWRDDPDGIPGGTSSLERLVGESRLTITPIALLCRDDLYLTLDNIGDELVARAEHTMCACRHTCGGTTDGEP